MQERVIAWDSRGAEDKGVLKEARRAEELKAGGRQAGCRKLGNGGRRNQK